MKKNKTVAMKRPALVTKSCRSVLSEQVISGKRQARAAEVFAQIDSELHTLETTENELTELLAEARALGPDVK